MARSRPAGGLKTEARPRPPKHRSLAPDLEVSCCTEPSLLTLNLPPSPRAQNRLWKKYRSALRRLDRAAAHKIAVPFFLNF